MLKGVITGSGHFILKYRGCHTSPAGMDLNAVVSALTKFAPPSLAGSWDNVGLLIEPSSPHKVERLFLTNDLSEEVMEEAVFHRANMILSYHPPIFSPLKRLTQSSWKERITIKCMENRIALYSPHTCLDALDGGVNDWLISPFGSSSSPLETVYQTSQNTIGKNRVDVSLPKDQSPSILSKIKALQNVQINSSQWNEIDGENILRLSMTANSPGLTDLVAIFNDSDDRIKKTLEITELQKIPIPKHGCGRICKMSPPLPLSACIKMVKTHLKLNHIRLAKAVGKEEDPQVKSIAVCAGSGGSVLRGVDADLYITGELSHHEALDIIHHGRSVILCEHSNTERGYLHVLKDKLFKMFNSQVEVVVSELDADPLKIL